MYLKKLATAAISSILIIMSSIPVFAAELNSAESSIVTTLQNNSVPAEYVTQARNYFLLDSVNITDAQASAINSHIAAAKTVAGSAKSISELSDKQQTSIINELSAAGQTIGLTVTYDASAKALLITDGRTVIFESVAGKVTSSVPASDNKPSNGNNSSNSGSQGNSGSSTSNNGIVKPTGGNMYITFAVIGSLTVVLAGCGIVIYRKNSLQKEV